MQNELVQEALKVLKSESRGFIQEVTRYLEDIIMDSLEGSGEWVGIGSHKARSSRQGTAGMNIYLSDPDEGTDLGNFSIFYGANENNEPVFSFDGQTFDELPRNSQFVSLFMRAYGRDLKINSKAIENMAYGIYDHIFKTGVDKL